MSTEIYDEIRGPFFLLIEMLYTVSLSFSDFWGQNNGCYGMVDACVNSIVCHRYNERYRSEYVQVNLMDYVHSEHSLYPACMFVRVCSIFRISFEILLISVCTCMQFVGCIRFEENLFHI